MHKNEQNYRNWLVERTKPGKSLLSVHNAIYGGAEACSCSPTKTREYLQKLLSAEGRFEVAYNIDHSRHPVYMRVGSA